MSKLHIESIDELDNYEWAPDDQEVVVTMGMLRELRPVDSATTAEVLGLIQAQQAAYLQAESEAEAAAIVEEDNTGRNPNLRLARRKMYEAAIDCNPMAWQDWQWREFGQSARWRPCTRPITWSNHFDFRPKPSHTAEKPD